MKKSKKLMILTIVSILVVCISTFTFAAETTTKDTTKTDVKTSDTKTGDTSKTDTEKSEATKDTTKTNAGTSGTKTDGTSKTDTKKPETTEDKTGTEQKNELTWTDGTKIKFTIEKKQNGSYYDWDLKGTGLTQITGHSYYVYITRTKAEPKIEVGTSGTITNSSLSVNSLFNPKYGISAAPYLELNGDIYVWLYEEQVNSEENKDVHKAIVAGQKVERPALPALGGRIKCYFFGKGSASGAGYTSTFVSTPRDISKNERKINLKIGRISDKDILRSIQKGEKDCLSKLLAYAKSAKSVYTGTVPIGESASITSKFDIVNDGYYYVYMELEDENGKYYPVEDVSLYQGCVSDSVGKNLFDYLSDEFKWNLDDDGTSTPTTPAKQPENNNPDNTTAPVRRLPQAGEKMTIVAAIAGIIVLAVIFARKFKKYNV